MRATISHNLSTEELTKALAALADESQIGEALLKAVAAKTSAIDCEPKEPRDPAMRHLYRLLVAENRRAMDDITRYAAEIASGTRSHH